VSDDGHFLSRWSRRKSQARRGEPAPPEPKPPAVASEGTPPRADSSTPAAAEPTPLPAVESLTGESDFTPFMREGVDPSIKRQALRTLFRDPRFNVMDGLDVYIDDYSKPDPLPEGWLEKMNQVAHLGEFRPKEPENAQAVESNPSPTGIPLQSNTEQQLAAPQVAASPDTPNKGEANDEGGKSG